MKKGNDNRLLRAWYTYLFIFFGLVLFNLDRIPVAWLDESYWLDVANNLTHGSFTSKIWPHPGTDEKMLAYMPFIFFYDAFFMLFLPDSIFWFRLPYILAFVVALRYLWKTYRQIFQLSVLPTLVLLLVFMGDKGVFESLRSFRGEVLAMMLLAPAIYFFLQNKKAIWVAFLLSMVFLLHPSLWVLVGVLMLYLFFRVDTRQKVIVSLVFVLPVLAFLIYANFDFLTIKEQLIDHGEEHMAKGNLLVGHFWSRYWPYYQPQPWVPFLNLLITCYCIYGIYKDKSIVKRPLEVAFLLTSVYWLFVLAPNYRYNTPNILLMFVLLPKPLLLIKERYFDAYMAVRQKQMLKVAIVLAIPFIVLAQLPVISRNVLAIVQRTERNPYAAMDWLGKHFDNNKKILLVDNSIAHYYALQRPNIDFALVYSVYKYNFADYDEVYLVSVNPKDSITLIDEYLPEKGRLFGREIGQGAVTYYGLKLYKINSETELRSLQRGYTEYAENRWKQITPTK